MPKALIVHHDKHTRSVLEGLLKDRYLIEGAKNVKAGAKQMIKGKPDVVVIGQDTKEEAARLLTYMRDNQMKKPAVVVVLARGMGMHQQKMMKLGAKGMVEYPVEKDRLCETIHKAMRQVEVVAAGPPPITQEELDSNLSMLENQLNQKMKCFAGRNQVFIRSMITGGVAPQPRICVRCPLREEFGLNREVFYEFIRDVCCSEPGQCEAVQLFRSRESA